MQDRPRHDTPGSRDRAIAIYACICLCFALSGMAALIYQVAWTRQFALTFGTSDLAVATVLAAYMGGLALGARLVERYLPRIDRPVRLYIWLEIAIAAAAVIWVPATLWLGDLALIAGFGGQAEPPSSEQAPVAMFYLVTAFVALIVPTALMGATLPVLVRYAVGRDEEVGRRTGQLYAFNTGGAVAGALGAALLILPAFGLQRTIFLAAFVNALVALIAWFLAGRLPVQTRLADAARHRAVRFTPKLAVCSFWVLPVMLLSGAVSFVHEVFWTRMLQHVVGSSVFAFGIMVASFLLGIAIGGAVGSVIARTRQSAVHGLAVSQVGIAAGGVAAWYLLNGLAVGHASLGTRIWLSLGVLLPLTFFVGMTFPLAVRILARDADEASPASARVYAWNTVGAIAGALAGGFVLIPWLRYEGAIQVLFVVSLILAGLVAIVLRPLRRSFVAAIAGVSVIGVILFQPAVPEKILGTSPLSLPDPDFLEFYAVGKTADVTVFRDGNTLALRTNGLPESGTRIRGAVQVLDPEAWMSPMAVFARPDAENMLIVGFGAGSAVEAVPPTVRAIDVIELEQQVIAANRAISDSRSRDPLDDERLNLIVNDARGALILTDKRYDLIISQPSHPWTAGASHLYTRGFMRQVSNHLNRGGVFVQWMSTDFVDEALLKSLTATLLSEFRELRVYRPYPTTMLFVASDEPLEIELDKAGLSSIIDASLSHYASIGINAAEDVAAILALDTAAATEFSRGSPPITDDHNRLATSRVFDLRRTVNPAFVSQLLEPYDPLDDSDFRSALERQGYAMDYIWRRIRLWSHVDVELISRLNRLAGHYLQSDLGVYMGVLLSARLESASDAMELLDAGLARWPDSQLLLFTRAEQGLMGAPVGESSLQGLQGEPELVYRAVNLARQQQWDRVAALDGQLARISWTAPWYWIANRVRAEMRARVLSPDLTGRAGVEGISLLDRGLIVRPDIFGFFLRAENAMNADLPREALESIGSYLAQLEQAEDENPDAVYRQLLQRTSHLKDLFDRIDRARVDEFRYDQVADELDAWLREAQRALRAME